MPYSNINTSLTTIQLNDVKTKINDIKAILVFLINLTMAERGGLYKMGNIRYTLATKALQHGTNNASLIIGAMSLTGANTDKLLYDQLMEIRGILASLIEGIDDTKMAAGSEVLTLFVKPLWGAVKILREQNVPGMDAIYDDLFPFYDLPDQPDGGTPD